MARLQQQRLDEFGERTIKAQGGDACEPPAELREQLFDLVFSNSVIEHVRRGRERRVPRVAQAGRRAARPERGGFRWHAVRRYGRQRFGRLRGSRGAKLAAPGHAPLTSPREHLRQRARCRVRDRRPRGAGPGRGRPPCPGRLPLPQAQRQVQRSQALREAALPGGQDRLLVAQQVEPLPPEAHAPEPAEGSLHGHRQGDGRRATSRRSARASASSPSACASYSATNSSSPRSATRSTPSFL